MRTSWTIFATALVVTNGTFAMATPAQAGWRDYVGKTIVAVLETTIHSGWRDVEDADLEPITMSLSRCETHQHFYVSAHGHLFAHTPTIKCDESPPYVANEVKGEIYDLTLDEGVFESGYGEYGNYRVTSDGDRVIIHYPFEDRVIERDNVVTHVTRASGSRTITIEFSNDCRVMDIGESFGRFDMRFRASNSRSVSEGQTRSSSRSISCEIVDGFR